MAGRPLRRARFNGKGEHLSKMTQEELVNRYLDLVEMAQVRMDGIQRILNNDLLLAQDHGRVDDERSLREELAEREREWKALIDEYAEIFDYITPENKKRYLTAKAALYRDGSTRHVYPERPPRGRRDTARVSARVRGNPLQSTGLTALSRRARLNASTRRGYAGAVEDFEDSLVSFEEEIERSSKAARVDPVLLLTAYGQYMFLLGCLDGISKGAGDFSQSDRDHAAGLVERGSQLESQTLLPKIAQAISGR